jgi:cytochrome c biogenesis protein CcmG/thiol:disulfide interchange protein DsbE
MIRLIRWTAGALCLIAAAALVYAAGLPERAAYTGVLQIDGTWIAPEIGAFAPEFSAVGLDGRGVSAKTWLGQPAVINFWATWCIPCEIELPELIALSENGVRVLAVNLGESPAQIQGWLAARQLTPTPDFIIPLDLTGMIAARYALRGQPMSFVLAPDGKIAHIFFGATTRSAVESVLAPYR